MPVAMDAARYDPDLSRKVAQYLEDQGALVRLQIKHFDQERMLALETLKRRRFADRLRSALSGFVILGATVVGLGALVIIVDAFRSQSVIVEPFDAPLPWPRVACRAKLSPAHSWTNSPVCRR